jgi:thymidylate synthase
MSLNLSFQSVDDVREDFAQILSDEEFVIDKSGCKMIEIINANFIADEASIFGEINHNYIQREMNWYNAESLNVNDIEPPVPKIWLEVADHAGMINSNYGFLVFNPKNHSQYYHVFRELLENPYSRRAIMLYNRPSMWEEYDKNGMSDFICCTSVQYFIRGKHLIAKVDFRSNDAVFGYKNDYAWQRFVHEKLLADLQEKMPDLELGPMIWNVGSLHVYERHFYLVEYFLLTGKWDATKSEVDKHIGRGTTVAELIQQDETMEQDSSETK